MRQRKEERSRLKTPRAYTKEREREKERLKAKQIEKKQEVVGSGERKCGGRKRNVAYAWHGDSSAVGGGLPTASGKG